MTPIPPPDAIRGAGRRAGGERWGFPRRAVTHAPGTPSLEPIDYPALRSAVLRELSRAGRHGERLSCLAIGFDGLERPSDRMGELRRNCVLAASASVLRDALRVYDTVARYGSDEFLVLLPATPLETAASLAERLRYTVRRTALGVLPQSIEISVGVAELDDPAVTADQLLDRADRALRAARSGGRKVLAFPELDRAEPGRGLVQGPEWTG